MKTRFLFTFLICFAFTSMSAQPIWELTFSKNNQDYKDYSITTAADGSGDLLLAGTLKNKSTNKYQAHIIRIDDANAAVVFEQTYDIGDNTWAMSITPYQVSAGTGYAVTGYAEVVGIRRTMVLVVDELGNVQQSRLLDQGGTATTTNGIGLHIKSTPNASDEGFVVVGMIHEDPGLSELRFAQKQGFCVKLDQSLNITWETYLDVPLTSVFPTDFDVASFVIPTDQGYFITGGKNILTTIGQQRQGILAVMLDHNGTEIWDASYYTGNYADNGASAYYDQSSQEVFVLTNISVSHHLGLSIFNANTGVLNNSSSFESYSSNFDLDKYGYTLVKAPFSDKLLIQGRGYDFQWTNNSNRLQPAFLVDYDLSTRQFGVHYSETNPSQAFTNLSTEDPFYSNPFRLYYYPQSLVNINAQNSAMVSYTGSNGDDLSLVVRQFSHVADDEYKFCNEKDTFYLDATQQITGVTGDPIVYSSPNTLLSIPFWNVLSGITVQDSFCLMGEENFLCEENLVQNGDFEQGIPTIFDEDITNATNWGGIWSNAGTTFSSGDFYSDLTGVPPGLTPPLPASQGQFGGFWSRIQGGNIYREGVLNELNTTIMPNSGIYELTLKLACLFTPNTPASMSILVANGSINGGAPLTSGTAPLNNGLFADSWEFAIEPIPADCDNYFQTLTFFLDTYDPSFPTTGVNTIFFTRTDGVQPGAYLALDDVCLRWVAETFYCEGNMVQNGDFEQGIPTTSDEDITNANNWGGIWSNAGAGFSSGDFYSDLTGVPPGLTPPLPISQGQFGGFWSRIQGGNIYREGILNELNGTIMPNTGVYELTFKTACLYSPSDTASMSVFVANGSINGGAPLISGTVPLNNALFANSWEIVVHPIAPDCDNNFQSYTYLMDSGDPSFPASGINTIFFTRTDGVQTGAFMALDDVCLSRRNITSDTEVLFRSKDDFNIYPNPTSDRVYLEWEEAGQFVNGILRNINGAVLQTLAIPDAATNVSMSLQNLPKGVYIVQLVTAKGQQVTQRVIKQ
ncbi:MAG: T9SS type A sorting domain-containing protein [Chitinophagales bacterium]|nr:T9SS type A sorting domain-containing protein [Chitinophagales bacterium]